MCDLIKLSTTITIAPCWLWLRGYVQPPSYVELVETSHWRVSLLYYAYSSPSHASNRHYVGERKSLGGRK